MIRFAPGVWPCGSHVLKSVFFTSTFSQERQQPRCTGTLSIRPSCWRRACWRKRGMHMGISTIACPPQAGASWRSVLDTERPPKPMRWFSFWRDTWKASSPPSMCNPDGNWWVWWPVKNTIWPKLSQTGQGKIIREGESLSHFQKLAGPYSVLSLWGRWWTIIPTWFHSWSMTQRRSAWFRVSSCGYHVLLPSIYSI